MAPELRQVGSVLAGTRLVPRHSDYDWLILSQSRMGISSGATRIWMLRATPVGAEFRSSVRIIWWTEGGLTWKCRCMSVSAGGRRNMCE